MTNTARKLEDSMTNGFFSDNLATSDKDIFDALGKELNRQQTQIELVREFPDQEFGRLVALVDRLQHPHGTVLDRHRHTQQGLDLEFDVFGDQ